MTGNVTGCNRLSACLFVTFVLIFHVGLKFIFCRRWQVVYVSLAHMFRWVTTRHYNIKLSVDKIIIIIIIEIIIIAIIINKK